MTSAMAVCEMSMLPSTHCSAARSCGGVRSNSLSRDDISVTLTSTPPVALAHWFHVYLTATTVWVLALPYAKPVVERVVDGLCIHAETAVHTACGQPVDYFSTPPFIPAELAKRRPPPVGGRNSRPRSSTARPQRLVSDNCRLWFTVANHGISAPA